MKDTNNFLVCFMKKNKRDSYSHVFKPEMNEENCKMLIIPIFMSSSLVDPLASFHTLIILFNSSDQ